MKAFERNYNENYATKAAAQAAISFAVVNDNEMAQAPVFKVTPGNTGPSLGAGPR